ncbi:gluconate 2-dehydrogenase subunit 3 family protein [Leeuwenhoekiella marinoflava]|uniref:Gluconate 2-dehydrogenase subunit 3-like protein n=2 Tax=Leeuwenhoekiella marinoflava TaxID=988 RepID=A0A4Q0PR99_9FLAO|nr:gluconate 2-dehydrogenase subunit 3 family protein [Leeuwenhoekiella marinoflava]RXG33126.1 gluconate 2-dehydrogenase subunit 3-like protein [Leeuwenhoekiella marinoflava]SHE39294.1 Gluconate 2-dehydrogenase subunit 3 [Leeuwenhoekiella marinoflava DSM 3653]
MKRRQVLKNIGLGAGYVAVAPAVFSLLQSCKSEPKNEWQPVFLNVANGFALTQVLDVILPKTDTPGASELNIAQFIDSYMNEVAGDNQKEEFKSGANAFALSFKENFDKEVNDGEAVDFEKAVAKYLGADKETRDGYVKRISETQDPDAPEADFDAHAGSYAYLNAVRDLGIWAWKNSEAVGENVLWYDPIPGAYIGCLPESEAGGGKVMSL